MFEGWRSSPHPSPRILVGLLWFSWRLLLRPSGRPSQGSWVPPPTRVILSGVPPARHPLEPLPLLRRHLPSRPFCRSVEIKSVFPDVLGTRIGGLEASAWLPLGRIDVDPARSLAETSVPPSNSIYTSWSPAEYPGRPRQTLASRHLVRSPTGAPRERLDGSDGQQRAESGSRRYEESAAIERAVNRRGPRTTCLDVSMRGRSG